MLKVTKKEDGPLQLELDFPLPSCFSNDYIPYNLLFAFTEAPSHFAFIVLQCAQCVNFRMCVYTCCSK